MRVFRSHLTVVGLVVITGLLLAGSVAYASDSSNWYTVRVETAASRIAILGQGPTAGNVTFSCFVYGYEKSTNATVPVTIQELDGTEVKATKSSTVTLDGSGAAQLIATFDEALMVYATVTTSACSGKLSWSIKFTEDNTTPRQY